MALVRGGGGHAEALPAPRREGRPRSPRTARCGPIELPAADVEIRGVVRGLLRLGYSPIAARPEPRPMPVRLTRAIEFSSSLRYARPDLSEAENRARFGRRRASTATTTGSR